MGESTYSAFFYRQRPNAPLQVAFVATSSEVDSWARVPTKRTGNVRNFQRLEIEGHIKEVQRFFSDGENSSPTSVVIGFDPIRSLGKVTLFASSGDVLAGGAVPAGTTIQGQIKITWPTQEDPQSSEELKSAIEASLPVLRSFVFSELSDVTGMGRASIDVVATALGKRVLHGEVPVDADAEVMGPSVGDAGEDAEDSAEPVEGSDVMSLLNGEQIDAAIHEELAKLSPSERQVVAGRLLFVARLQPQLLEKMSETDLRALFREVCDELKPGILIDGQHRISGTKTLGRIPFLVTAIPEATWPELAFQFIVTNRTARKVPESLLISIVGNSLSREQRAAIEERLRNASIRVGLIEAVMRVHEDELSPFYGMLAFGLKGEGGFIDAAALRNKVIKVWFERQPPVRQLLDHFCQGRTASDRTEYWKAEDVWFRFFIAFWSAVRDRYAGSTVFSTELKDKTKKTPASLLMTATVLMIFQQTVLEEIHEFLRLKQVNEDIPIAKSLVNEAAFAKFVRNKVDELPPEFFVGWKLTGFDGSKGARDDLADAIRQMINRVKPLSQLKEGKSAVRLFRAQPE